jgi:hypothetical protein
VRKAENLPPSSADVTEFGNLNLPEPSGPHRPVMEMLYLYLYLYNDLMLTYAFGVETSWHVINDRKRVCFV